MCWPILLIFGGLLCIFHIWPPVSFHRLWMFSVVICSNIPSGPLSLLVCSEYPIYQLVFFQTIGYFSKYLFVALTCFNAFISSSFLSITFSYVIYCLFFLIYIGCYSIQFRLHLRAHWISAWWNLIPTLRNSHVFYVFFQARIVIHNYNCVLHLLYFIYNCI